MKILLLLLILFLNFSCATYDKLSLRYPSSKSPDCIQIFDKFLHESHSYSLVEQLNIYKNEIKSINKDSKIVDVILLDGLPETQRRNELIFGILKNKYPSKSSDQLISTYHRLFTSCDSL